MQLILLGALLGLEVLISKSNTLGLDSSNLLGTGATMCQIHRGCSSTLKIVHR